MNGRESTVSLQDLPPHSKTFDHSVSVTPNQLPNYNRNVGMNCETVVPEVNNEHSEYVLNPYKSLQKWAPIQNNVLTKLL